LENTSRGSSELSISSRRLFLRLAAEGLIEANLTGDERGAWVSGTRTLETIRSMDESDSGLLHNFPIKIISHVGNATILFCQDCIHYVLGCSSSQLGMNDLLFSKGYNISKLEREA